jgi:hypothetical protein
MAPTERPDPVRATLIAILQQLNRYESLHEGREREQTLELADLERLLRRFWAIDQGATNVGHALGLLLRNKMVQAHGLPALGGARHGPPRYRITAQGKQFLIEALARAERIP